MSSNKNKGNELAQNIWILLFGLTVGILLVAGAAVLLWTTFSGLDTPSIAEKASRVFGPVFMIAWGILFITLTVRGLRKRSVK